MVLLCKPTYLCCFRLYLPTAGLVVYCLLACGVVVRTWITGLFHWPAVLLLVCYIGGRFEYTCSPSGLFCCFFCMVLLSAVCFLWFHIHAYCSVCVQHMLMLGYYFYVPCVNLVPYCDWSTRLSYVIHSTCITFYFIYPTWVFVAYFLH